MKNFPTVSIVIPTHNRCALLAQGLAALATQSWAGDDFEVIVVADACEDATLTMVADYARQVPYCLKLLHHNARSASATRNLGAAEARGQILIFIDDDIVAAPNFIAAHVQAQMPQTIVLGYSKPVISAQATWWEQNAWNWWEDAFTAMAQPGHRFTYRDCFSSNVSLARALFQQVRGFDEGIKGRLEDYELGIRLLKAGVAFQFEPAAQGDHHDQTNLVIWLKRIRQEGVADVQIAQRHPEIGTTLFGIEDPLAHPNWRLRFLRRFAFLPIEQTDLIMNPLLRAARFCERVQFYGFWQRITGLLREYTYWRGVALAVGSAGALRRWLQDMPMVPNLSTDAPLLDMAQLPTAMGLESVLACSAQRGLRVALHGHELFTVAPTRGAEPLTLAHLQARAEALAQTGFVPPVAHPNVVSFEQARV